MTKQRRKQAKTAPNRVAATMPPEPPAQEQPVPQPEPEPQKQMTTIEKVKLMSDLANVVQNPDVVNILGKLPNGQKIYEIFVAAIDKELSNIMNGRDEEAPKQANNLMAAAIALNNSGSQLQYLVSSFMQTPLVQVLNLLNQNLGGQKFQFQEPDPEQMQALAAQANQTRTKQPKQPPPPQPPQQPQAQPQQPQQAPRQPGAALPPRARGGSGAPGLGSF